METWGASELAGEAETAAAARRLAPLLRPGDCLLLSGEIGAGKSTFARALIRAALGDEEAEVPSPTFTLVQPYAAPVAEIWHADLYRLGDPGEVAELGLWEALEDGAICLIEWPERLEGSTPVGALHLHLQAGEHAHRLALSGPQAWRDRLEAAFDPV
ncbi:tRNA (adenosine(37)-N6)-threonylcarbamoyltransferase complex ATPase subunit type 1 TsaE [Pseudoroseicyclus tamaricis]|uniref:tRNA threonylcarbamoyladenosine biosynthesis protein TsaE n=1 Tax=Pseudoroseicyclus tamaricis TaxID=2705421 RepID=A0A6B2JMI5_9RHOB|nr:tRNA (adenosine(37)-N6)-threonylcarbamoyltransferase complex ATPase subunit type 1 TsaE [Pseudoroseicyclus tamaricis]NDV02803.1 tRNA (adenosine(37)-N6)-threonylcarbamoyltransferase complex ATPase subunit type 1 TsaE [Pseudoroseicyclus tamaricis]